jgi:hypothetical protein
MVERVAAWLVGAMMAFSPPIVKTPAEQARYEAIARDLAAVTFDANEKPAFEGEDGRAKTALLMAAIASFESGYRADVDDGRTRGDHGNSWCLMQVRVIGKTREGYTGEDLVKDRTKCFRVALRLIRQSFAWCKTLPIEDRLAAYTVGVCKENEPLARNRFYRARSYWKDHPLDVSSIALAGEPSSHE